MMDTREEGPPSARWVPWLVLALGLATTLFLFFTIRHSLHRRNGQEFARREAKIVEDVRGLFADQVSVLYALAGAVEAHPDLNQREFELFHRELTKGSEAKIPATMGLSLSRPWAQRSELENQARSRGIAAFDFRPTTPRAEAHAVILVQPLSGRNLDAPGFDMHADPIRAGAMDLAMRTGRPAMTPSVVLHLDSEPNQAFLLYLPVRDDATGRSLGTVYTGFRAKDLFATLGESPDLKLVRLRLWSGPNTDRRLVYEGGSGPVQKDDPLKQTFDIDLGVGQKLAAEMVADADIGGPPVIFPYVLPVGGSLSVLLFMLAAVLKRSQEVAARSASEQQLLAEVGRLSTENIEDPSRLQEVAASIARTLGCVCRIDLLDAEGGMRTVEAGRGDGFGAEWEGALAEALSTRTVRQVSAGGSTVVVPLTANEQSMGAFSLHRHPGEKSLETEAVDLARAVAARVALGIENGRLYRDLERRVSERTRDLEASNRELESFCYSVSHDLRTPLRSLDGFGRALREDYEEVLDETGLDYIERIRAATKRMDELITALLTLSRLTRREILPIDVDVTSIVHDQLQDLDPEGRIEKDVEDGIRAYVDPRMMAVVMDNLLSNAVKFSGHAAEPRIEVGTNGEGEIFVRDNGAGFDMAYANKLFQPFERLHSVREFPGHGIGLATVERIVRRHGGDVRAEGTPGKGATFFLRFPPKA